MSSQTITNYYEHPPMNGRAPTSVVFLLHGLGSNGQDLISLAPYWAEFLPNTHFISPDAPFACDMAPAGYPNSYQWFSLQNRDPEAMRMGAESTFPILQNFVQTQQERLNISAGKTALVGFSQGTMMSLYSAPRFKDKIAGIVGYSGALLGEKELIQNPEAFQHLPVHLIHGEADDVVPFAAYTHAVSALNSAKFDVSGHSTPGLTHSIDEQGIQSAGQFLSRIL